MPIFDIFNQAHLQRTVTVGLRTRLEQTNPVVRELVTVVPTTEDKIRLTKAEVKAFGYAKPKAFGATPNIYVPKVRYSDVEIELLPMHEMRPIDERTMRKLESQDQNIRERAGADVALSTLALAQRNETGWDVLTMNAILTGQLNVLFKDETGSGFNIDYGYDPTHLVRVAISWANLASSKPIDELRAVQLLMANTVGDYAVHFWMSSNTARGIFESAQAKELLTGTERAQYIPERADVVRRLYEPERVQFHITDSGYRGETYARDLSAHTKYIPDGKIIATTDDPYEGENIVEVYDGMVGVPVSEFRKPDFRQGQQSWVKLDTDSLTTYYHNASTRIPMINRPENIIIIDTQAVPA